MSTAKGSKKKSGVTPQQLLELGKIPPQAIELEEAVLGAMMLDRDALANVIDLVKPDMFYKEAHRHIFQAIHDLFHDSSPVDILTVTQQLKKNGELQNAGDAHYITTLTNRIASSSNVEYHARLVIEQFLKREVIRVAQNILQEGFEDTSDVFSLLESAEQQLFDVSQNNIKKNYKSIKDLLGEAIKQIEGARDQQFQGVPSGYSRMDAITGGWQNADFILLAARPAMGKCFGKGTKIIMYDGSLKNVEDIKAGDILMGDDSTPRNVLSIARGREMMYDIAQNYGITYKVNESHILSLKRSRTEWKHNHGDVLNISVREYLTKSKKWKSNYKGYKSSFELPEKEVPIDPYFTGLWIGDGSSDDSSIFNVDKEVLSYLKYYAKSIGKKLSIYKKVGKCPELRITNGRSQKSRDNSIKSKLRKLGMINNKHIPDVYLRNSKKIRLSLLAGIIDSDGHYPKQKGNLPYEITQKNKELAKQIKFLCDSLGFRTYMRRKKAKCQNGYSGYVWRLRINGNIDEIPVKIKRKKAIKWAGRRDWQAGAIKVIPDKIDNYYGFEIDGNRLFMLEDCTVVHNTAFAISVARNAAVDFGKPIAIFSLEMTAVQLTSRLISMEAEFSSEKLRKGDLTSEDFINMNHKISKLAEAPIFIDDTPALSVFDFRAKARRLKSQHGVGLIVIDYLQLMTMGAGKKGNREQEVSMISQNLKAIAKELNIPIIALSQLSRAVETRDRGSKKPQLSDLRESGSLEQDADLVMFLYRPEYYGITVDDDGNSTEGIAEVIIAKHRNGRVGSEQLMFIPHLTKFIQPTESLFYEKKNEEAPFGSTASTTQQNRSIEEDF